MQAQVKTWGNSQGVRISKEILKAANIRASKTGITNCYYIYNNYVDLQKIHDMIQMLDLGNGNFMKENKG